MPPVLKEVLLLGLLNPVAIYAGYLLGRRLGQRQDQKQKVIVSAIPAGLAGLLFTWGMMWFGVIAYNGQLLPGVLVCGMLIGGAAALLGYEVHSRHTRLK